MGWSDGWQKEAVICLQLSGTREGWQRSPRAQLCQGSHRSGPFGQAPETLLLGWGRQAGAGLPHKWPSQASLGGDLATCGTAWCVRRVLQPWEGGRSAEVAEGCGEAVGTFTPLLNRA